MSNQKSSHALRQVEELDDEDRDSIDGQSRGSEGHLAEAHCSELVFLLGLTASKEAFLLLKSFKVERLDPNAIKVLLEGKVVIDVNCRFGLCLRLISRR